MLKVTLNDGGRQRFRAGLVEGDRKNEITGERKRTCSERDREKVFNQWKRREEKLWLALSKFKKKLTWIPQNTLKKYGFLRSSRLKEISSPEFRLQTRVQ